MNRIGTQNDELPTAGDLEPVAAPSANGGPSLARGLGWREREIMKILWAQGGASVQEVTQALSSTLAYTTVMTTLDRLFKKGLLQREKKHRAYIYSPSLSSREVERQRTAGLVQRLFEDSRERPEILLSCLVDAVDQYDAGLLDELEARVKAAREQAARTAARAEDSQ